MEIGWIYLIIIASFLICGLVWWILLEPEYDSNDVGVDMFGNTDEYYLGEPL